MPSLDLALLAARIVFWAISVLTGAVGVALTIISCWNGTAGGPAVAYLAIALAFEFGQQSTK